MIRVHTILMLLAGIMFGILSSVQLVSAQTFPGITGVSYSEQSKTLEITFDAQVQAQNTLLGLISIDDDNGGINEDVFLTNAQVISQGKVSALDIQVVKSGDVTLAKAIEALDHSSMNLLANASAFLAADSVTSSPAYTLDDNITIQYNENPSPTEVTAAGYNAYTNTLSLILNEPVLVSMVNELGIGMGDGDGGNVPFQGSVTLLETTDSDTIHLTLNSRLAQQVEQLNSTSLFVRFPRWTLVDTLYNAVVPLQNYAVSFQSDTGATFNLANASYDPLKNKLALSFHRTLKFKSIVANKITFSAGGNSYTLLGKQDDRYTADTLVTVSLIASDQNNVEALLSGQSSFTISVGNYTVLDDQGNGNLESEVTGSLSDSLTAGTPVVMDSVKYNAETNELSIPFSQKMGTNIQYEGFKLINTTDQDTIVLSEPVKIGRQNVLQTLVLTLADEDAYQLESATASAKNGGLHITIDAFSSFDLINGNGNAALKSSQGFSRIYYTADTTEAALTIFFYDVQTQTANFTFDDAVSNNISYSSGDISIGGVAVTDVTVGDQETPNTLSLEVDETSANALNLENLANSKKVDLELSIAANLFKSPDGVGNTVYTAVKTGDMNPHGDAISTGYGRDFWVKSYEAFAPPPSKIHASIRGIGTKIRVYVDNEQWANGNVVQTDVDTLISHFEAQDSTGIYKFVTEHYGMTPLDFDGDPIINVLLTDILDEYDLGRNDTNDKLYVHGYYTPQDTMTAEDSPYSNQADLIYLDCNPQTFVGGDFATGFNAITNEFVKMLITQNKPQQEPWIREGLATMAEFGVLGDYSMYGGSIGTPAGNQLTYIQGSLKTRNDEVNAFLFHLYLYEKYGGFDILKDIAMSDSAGISTINEVLQKRGIDKTAADIFGDYSVACFLDLPQENNAYNGRYSFDNVNIADSPVNKSAKPFNWSTDDPGPYPQKNIQPWSFNFYVSIAYSLDLEGNPAPKTPLLDPQGTFRFNGKDGSAFVTNKVMLRSTYLATMDPDYSVTTMDIQGDEQIGEMPVSEPKWVFDNSTTRRVATDSSAALAFMIVSKTTSQPPSNTYDFVISSTTTQPDYADFLTTQIPTSDRYLQLYAISQRRIYNGAGVEGPIVEVWTDADTIRGEVRMKDKMVLDELYSKNNTSLVYQGTYEFTSTRKYDYEFRFFGEDLSGNNIGGSTVDISAMYYNDNTQVVSLDVPKHQANIVFKPHSLHNASYITAAVLPANITFTPGMLNKATHTEALTPVGNPILFGPVNVKLQTPATVTLPYSSTIENPVTLGIYYLYNGKWEYIGGKTDASSHTIHTQTNHLGYFIVMSGDHGATPKDLQVPVQYALNQSYPNPFNPTTQIRYSLAKQTAVSITVYNILGQKVRTLVSTAQPAGTYQVTWDARNDAGMNVGAGVYFIRMVTPDYTANSKTVYLK